MLFSKDGENYQKFGVNGKKFADALKAAGKSLRLEDGHKIFYKETESSNPLIMVFRKEK